MPSLFGHAIVGVTAAWLPPQTQHRKRLLAITLFCSILPDIDVATFVLGVPYESFFGHRGFSHSISFSALVGFLAGSAYLKKFKFKSIQDWSWVFYFFLVALSHPLLDAMTSGGHGVAIFSPFNLHRYFYFYRPIFVSPLSFSEFFTNTSIRILFSEATFILLPCLFIILLKSAVIPTVRRMLNIKPIPRTRKETGAILGILFCLTTWFISRGLIREELVPGINDVDVSKISANLLRKTTHDLDEVPLEDIPGKRLLKNYREILDHKLFDTVLTPIKEPWAGRFFPTWLGGAAGRWQDPLLLQIWKSMMGASFISKPDLVELLHQAHTPNPDQSRAASALERLSPTEKYDIAIGDYYLGATRTESGLRGRGFLDSYPITPFWSGYCNSISIAAIYEKEPKNAVTVVNSDGYRITFYPNDIKALLGIAYSLFTPKDWNLGNRCELDGPKSDLCLDIDPAAFVIALTNLIGLARTTFLIDKEPFIGIQNAPIRKAEIKIINPPYLTGERQSYFKVDTFKVKWLVDVEIDLVVSRITPLDINSGLTSGSTQGSMPGSSTSEENLTYRATLGLDSDWNLVGGRWEDPFHHPDFVWGGTSILTTPERIGEKLVSNGRIEWPVIQKLLEESAKAPLPSPISQADSPQDNVIEISKIIQEPNYHGFVFDSKEPRISGGISYLHLAHPIEVYGHMEGEGTTALISVELIGEGRRLALYDFPHVGSTRQQFFKLKSPGTLEDTKNVMLRFNLKGMSTGGPEFIQFDLPFKRKFERLIMPNGS